MITHFITALNGVISGQHCGDVNADFFDTPYYGHERIVIPADASVREFDKVEFYDKSWKRKPVLQLIEEGLIPMPEGYVVEAGSCRRMTQAERVTAGLDEPPPGCKLDGGEIVLMTQAERITAGLEAPPPGCKLDGGEIVPMTFEEQLTAGQITQSEYDQRLADNNEADLRHRLSELQTPEALARAELDDAYAAERKAGLAALLAVKDQKGWPLKVKWPVFD